MNNVCVLGLGYIGLPTATILAASGARVVGIDVRPEVVDTINQGAIHIEEPGLLEKVQQAVHSGNLTAALSPCPADVFIIAVPTPITHEHRADMSYVIAAAKSILSSLRPGNLVILESTSPPGTCRDLLTPLFAQAGFVVGKDISLAYCPERVLPGKILTELVENDRVVGGMDAKSAGMARDLYALFVKGNILQTGATTAEMIKLMENTFRDVNIALANEAARLCENLGIDFWEVARCANRHPRVNIHNAGPGVGGHCIAVDPWFLVEAYPSETGLIRTARERNDSMPKHVIATIMGLLDKVDTPKVACLGLAYKADVDDIRESPSLEVILGLEKAGLNVACHDPHVSQAPCSNSSLEECLKGADLVVLLTDHAEFKRLDPNKAGRSMRRHMLYDTRNALDHAAWRAAGFDITVLGAGRQVDTA